MTTRAKRARRTRRAPPTRASRAAASGLSVTLHLDAAQLERLARGPFARRLVELLAGARAAGAASEAPAVDSARIFRLDNYPCPWRGNPKVDGIVWPYNEKAPEPVSVGCRIETERAGGGWYTIPSVEGLWSLEDCAESAILRRWGGGRRYRVSIRWSGNTLPGSTLYYELVENRTPPRPVPGLSQELDPALGGSPAPTATATA